MISIRVIQFYRFSYDLKKVTERNLNVENELESFSDFAFFVLKKSTILIA